MEIAPVRLQRLQKKVHQNCPEPFFDNFGKFKVSHFNTKQNEGLK